MAKVRIGKVEKSDSLIKTEVTSEIKHETTKALLVTQTIRYEAQDLAGYGEAEITKQLKSLAIVGEVDEGTKSGTIEEWLPKSQVTVTESEIEIPEWLARQKLFIYA